MELNIDKMINAVESINNTEEEISVLEDMIYLLRQLALIQQSVINAQYETFWRYPRLRWHAVGNKELPNIAEPVILAYGVNDFGIGYYRDDTWSPLDNCRHCQHEPMFWADNPEFPGG